MNLARASAIATFVLATALLSGCIATLGALGAGAGAGMQSYVDAQRGVTTELPQPGQRTALWTGRSEAGSTVTGRSATVCEFDYFGTKFVLAFERGGCPSRVPVR